MSRAGLTVTFPDGSVRFGLYDGTADMAYPELFSTLEEAWASKDAVRDWDWAGQPDQMRAFPVALRADYGRGIEWEGTACPERLIEGLHPFDS